RMIHWWLSCRRVTSCRQHTGTVRRSIWLATRRKLTRVRACTRSQGTADLRLAGRHQERHCSSQALDRALALPPMAQAVQKQASLAHLATNIY
ncbi:hypothetical protein LPJ73_008257, partial [Coemansia sp. RSA 2703]